MQDMCAEKLNAGNFTLFSSLQLLCAVSAADMYSALWISFKYTCDSQSSFDVHILVRE